MMRVRAAALGFILLLVRAASQANQTYTFIVGEPNELTLLEGETAEITFNGTAAEKVGVSYWQCSGSVPQVLSAALIDETSGSESSAMEASPACVGLQKQRSTEGDVCVFPDDGFGPKGITIESEEDINPSDALFEVTNTGNQTAYLEIVMFTTTDSPPVSNLSLWEETDVNANQNGTNITVTTGFGEAGVDYCTSNDCIVTAYLNDFETKAVPIYVCTALNNGTWLHSSSYDGGSRYSVDLVLPEEGIFTLSLILADESTWDNTTSAMLAVNHDIIYQDVVATGDAVAQLEDDDDAASSLRNSVFLSFVSLVVMVVTNAIGAM